MNGAFYSLSVDTKGLWRLIRRKVHEEGSFKLHIARHPDTGKWHARTEWKPLNDFQADQPEHILHALGIILSPDPDIGRLEAELKQLPE